MGHNRYRFTLSHDSGSQVISEPEGWRDIKLTLERDKDFHSLIELFETALRFYGSNGEHDGGMDYIDNIDSVFGPDAQVSMLCEISTDGGYNFEYLFLGLLDMQAKKRIDSRRIEVPVIRDGFWARFKNRYDTPVDLMSETDEDGNTIESGNPVDFTLTSQKIQKKTLSEMEQSFAFDPSITTADYVQFDWDVIKLDEIEEKYTLPTDKNPDLPVGLLILKEAGEYAFDISVIFSDFNISGTGGIGDPFVYSFFDLNGRMDVFFQKNSEAPIAFTRTDDSIGGKGYSTFTFSDTIDIGVGDEIRLYGVPLINFNGPDTLILIGTNTDIIPDELLGFTFPSGLESHISIIAQTTYVNTIAEGFFLHDAGALIANRIIAKTNSFYSEYLGGINTRERSYDADGCEWHYALLRGLQIRQYELTDKPFSISFKQWWEGANPIFCLGLTYDNIDQVGDDQVIRVEHKSYFYDTDPVIYLDFVNNIVESNDKDMTFKKVKGGYKKWQSEDISGIDDVQTVHEYALLFKTIGTDLIIESDFIAGSLPIETTRRTTKEKSADYKYDNDTFIISLNPNPEGSPETFVPELDENFDEITGLLNPETRYNTRLSPARNILRWSSYIFGCVQKYLDSVLKFNRGEGNYDMSSTFGPSEDNTCPGFYNAALSEKQNIPVTNDYLFQPILLDFKFPLSFEDYKLIRDNRTKAIAVSESDTDHAICFIKKLEYDINNSLGTFTVWKR